MYKCGRTTHPNLISFSKFRHFRSSQSIVKKGVDPDKKFRLLELHVITRILSTYTTSYLPIEDNRHQKTNKLLSGVRVCLSIYLIGNKRFKVFHYVHCKVIFTCTCFKNNNKFMCLLNRTWQFLVHICRTSTTEILNFIKHTRHTFLFYQNCKYLTVL